MKKLLRIKDVAERLDMHRITAYKLIGSGGLPAVHIGRAVRVTPEALDAFIAAGGTKQEAPDAVTRSEA